MHGILAAVHNPSSEGNSSRFQIRYEVPKVFPCSLGGKYQHGFTLSCSRLGPLLDPGSFTDRSPIPWHDPHGARLRATRAPFGALRRVMDLARRSVRMVFMTPDQSGSERIARATDATAENMQPQWFPVNAHEAPEAFVVVAPLPAVMAVLVPG